LSAVKTQLHFLRYEFKYILSKSLRHEIENELSHFMELDPFVKKVENNKYFVRSLYFDDPFDSFYNEKVDGLLNRTKFRLRTYSYNYNKEIPIFLEIKGRYNNYVFKHRTNLKNNDYFKFIKKIKLVQNNNDIKNNYKENKIFNQFIYDFYRKKIKPCILIDYKRRPYISKYDYNFRLTFDEEIRAYKTNELFSKNIKLKRKVFPTYTILEIKFPKHIPAWFHRIIKTYELNRHSFSKYCKGKEKFIH
jgi:hypothetical protein